MEGGYYDRFLEKYEKKNFKNRFSYYMPRSKKTSYK